MIRLCPALVITLIFMGIGGCGPLDSPPQDTTTRTASAEPVEVPPLVLTERGGRGGRLVFVNEAGERTMDLTEIGPVPVRDNSPAWSPDGRWVVFASSRGRQGLLRTSLWIVAAEPGAQPRRLTSSDPDGEAHDRDPTWTPDGAAVVFASDREGRFDLWRLELTLGRYGSPMAVGEPTRITRSDHHALHPSLSPDGTRILYTEVDFESGRSALWMWSDGEARPLTEGPADATPAWSPDGKTIAFAALVLRKSGAQDTDIFLVDVDGGNRRLLADEPLATQTDPVWSPDGRFLFSTSLYRSIETGKPVLSSVTFVDRRAPEPVVRALHDPVLVASRAGLALAAHRSLDAAALGRNPGYPEALHQALKQEIIRHERGQPTAGPGE